MISYAHRNIIIGLDAGVARVTISAVLIEQKVNIHVRSTYWFSWDNVIHERFQLYGYPLCIHSCPAFIQLARGSFNKITHPNRSVMAQLEEHSVMTPVLSAIVAPL